MGQEFEGHTETWNRRQHEIGALRDAELNAELDDLLQSLPDEDEHPAGTESQESASKSAPPKVTAVDQKITDIKARRSAPTSFPVANVDALPIVVDPLSRLEALIDELRQHGDYRRVRDEYCQLSILINLQGAIAPAYRLLPKPGKRKGDPVFLEIHRDQLVIDCHWLHSKKERVRAKDGDFWKMFDSTRPFPFAVAWAFASKNWRKSFRANEALFLTSFQQCQLAALRSEAISERFNHAENGVHRGGGRAPAKLATVRQALGEWCERDRRIIPHYDDYVRLWLSRELLGAGAPIRQIAELFALMSGAVPRDDKTIRGKLEKMDRHIGGT